MLEASAKVVRWSKLSLRHLWPDGLSSIRYHNREMSLDHCRTTLLASDRRSSASLFSRYVSDKTHFRLPRGIRASKLRFVDPAPVLFPGLANGSSSKVVRSIAAKLIARGVGSKT